MRMTDTPAEEARIAEAVVRIDTAAEEGGQVEKNGYFRRTIPFRHLEEGEGFGKVILHRRCPRVVGCIQGCRHRILESIRVR